MNVEQAALMENDNLRHARVNSTLPERTVRLKLAERPDRDRIQRVVDLADALLIEAKHWHATRLSPRKQRDSNRWIFSAGLISTTRYERFETHLIKMALAETGGNQAKAARLLGIKATTLNSKIKLFKIDVGQTPQSSSFLINCFRRTEELGLVTSETVNTCS